MNKASSVHACLDGEVAPDTLSPAEAEDLAALGRDLAGAVNCLRPPPVDLRECVMQRIPEVTPSLPWTIRGKQPEIDHHRSASGIWTATVPLPPGVHDYLFMVDGTQWVLDPAGAVVEDHFGGTNSRLYLTHPTSSV
jgi:hypothetical protein